MRESEVKEEFPYLHTEKDRNFPLRLGSYFVGEGLGHLFLHFKKLKLKLRTEKVFLNVFLKNFISYP